MKTVLHLLIKGEYALRIKSLRQLAEKMKQYGYRAQETPIQNFYMCMSLYGKMIS